MSTVGFNLLEFLFYTLPSLFSQSLFLQTVHLQFPNSNRSLCPPNSAVDKRAGRCNLRGDKMMVPSLFGGKTEARGFSPPPLRLSASVTKEGRMVSTARAWLILESCGISLEEEWWGMSMLSFECPRFSAK